MAKTVADMVNSFERGRYAFSDFLGLSELDECQRELRDFTGVPFELWGGAETAERVMLKIGDEKTLGYDESYPISIIEIKPKSLKFSDDLSHRDFLGSLMNLGISRATLGDIYINENTGYVICTDKIADFITENLTRIKHTSVSCRCIPTLPELPAEAPREVVVQSASLRLDAVIARAYNLPRSKSQELFCSGRVYVGGRLCESAGYVLKQEETVSVRGYGRLRLLEECGTSRKGKLNIKLALYK